MRAAVYCRVSQDDKGDAAGVQRQERDCRALAEAKGYVVADVFTDNDISAYNGRARPGYKQLIDGLKDGIYDAVIAYKLDRLTRQGLRGLTPLLDALDGRTLACVHDAIDTSTPMGEGIAGMLASMAKQESANTGQRVADKKAELASKGLPAGGKRAFCYEPDGVTIRESEAKTYRKAARDVLAGKAWSAVAREWNDAGIAPPQAKKWSVTTVRYVLTSPRHAGLRVHRGKVQKQPAAWPGVIDLPTHEALVAAVKGGDQPRRRSLLTRLVVCDCGAPMTRDGRSFRCRACGSTVKADALENLIEEMVIELLGNSTRLAKVMANQGDEPDDAALDILRAEHKLAEAADLYAADEIGRKEWLRVRKVTQARLRDARRRLRRRTDANALERFRLEQHPADLYRKLDTDERRAVISAVIDRIVIAPARNRAPRLDPGRVRPIWRA